MTRPDPWAQRRAYHAPEVAAIRPRHQPPATYRLTAPCGRALATLTRQGGTNVPPEFESPAGVLAVHARRCFVCREVPVQQQPAARGELCGAAQVRCARAWKGLSRQTFRHDGKCVTASSTSKHEPSADAD